MVKAISVPQVIAAEAVSGTYAERWADMVGIASVIANRAAMMGVTAEDVVGLTKEFNAYNNPMPAGTQALTDMAEQAMRYVEENGPVHKATFYATPETVDNLPKGLDYETETTGHIYKSDPQFRNIETAQGYKKVNPENAPQLASQDPLQSALTRPYEANGLINGVNSLGGLAGVAADTAVTSQAMPAVAADPAFGANGLLTGTPQTFAGLLSPTAPQDSFGDVAAAGPMGLISAPDPTQQAMTGPYEANGLRNTITSASDVPSNVVQSTPVSGILSGPQDPAFGQNGLMAGAFPGEVSDTQYAASQAPAPSAANQSNFATGLLAQNDYAGAAPTTDRLNGSVVQTADPGRLAAPSQLDTANAALNASIQQAINTPNVANTDNFSALAAAGPVSAPMSVAAQGGLLGNPALSAAASVPMSAALFAPNIEQAPAANSFSELAAAGPISAPMDVSATGLLGGQDLAASAKAVPSVNATAAGLLGAAPNLQASAVASPQAATGITSPGFQEIAAQAQKNLADMQAQQTPSFAAPAVTPSVSMPTQNNFGDMAAAGPLATGLLSAPAVAAPQTMAVTPSLLSGTQLANVDPTLTSSVTSMGILSQPSLAGLANQYKTLTPPDATSLDVATPEVAPSTINIAQDPAVSMPNISTISVPDQPTIAANPTVTATTPTIDGPVNTPAVTQQQVTATAPSATGISGNAKKGLFSGLMNKETAIGGLLGGLTLGPVGGLLGGLLGSQVANNGGLTGLLGGPMSINNIGSGLANTSSVWGGAPMGTQAYTNNNGTVTSLGGGWTAVTGPSGVTTSFGPNNTHAGYFGADIGGRTPGGAPGGGGGGGSL